jgi:OHS family lactose permease-like MFS transporter
MMVRIGGSGLAVGPISISTMKLLHSLELPILIVSIFRYIAYHFDNRLASTVYMVGFSFGHSLGLSMLSPLVGKSYDLIGFTNTYLLLSAIGSGFLILSAFVLAPTPVDKTQRDRTNATDTPVADAAKATH